MTTLPPIKFRVVEVPPCLVDLEIHAALTKWIFPKDHRVDMVKTLNAQRSLIEGAWSTVDAGGGTRPHRSISKALEPLHEHLFSIRHWTACEKLESVKAMVLEALKEQPKRKIVVFAMCRDVIVWLKAALLHEGKTVHLFPGMDPKRAAKNLRKFNHVNKYRVIICDIEAAVPPVELMAGSLVIFLDQHFDPKVNATALMRVHNASQPNDIEVRCVALEKSYDVRLTNDLCRQMRKLVVAREKDVEIISTDDIIVLPTREDSP